jgi:spore coat polysaccharide biosynthesis protein SpsF
MKTVAIIQARMGSTRLPGKVLMDICGKPMLERVVERTKRAKLIDRVIVATTDEKQDNPIASLCKKNKYPVYRGEHLDVLTRYYMAAAFVQADTIVRITADCPLIDPNVIDRMVGLFYKHKVDYATNRLPEQWGGWTYPVGLDVEIFSWEALERACHEANTPDEREHVTLYFYDDMPHKFTNFAITPRGFKILLYKHMPPYKHLRWTVDTAEDLKRVRGIYQQFNGRDDFSWKEAL